MTYKPDLTPYDFYGVDSREFIKNPPPIAIGWLEAGHEFTRGYIEGVIEEVHARLLEFAQYKVRAMRGTHCCDLCNPPTLYKHHAVGVLSTAEIWIRGPNHWYGCPNLILHYIESHSYIPPQEFIDAVLNGPAPFSREYEQALLDLYEELRWTRRWTPRAL